MLQPCLLRCVYLVVIVQSPSYVQVFATPWTEALQASLSLTISQVHVRCIGVCPSSFSLHWWCHPAISSSDALFCFCPRSFPASGTFLSHLFASDDQNMGASSPTSVLLMSIQSWFFLRLTSFIFLLSKRLSGVFSSTTVWRHQFFGILPSLWSSSHNHMWPLGRLDDMDLCQQSNVFSFQHTV